MELKIIENFKDEDFEKIKDSKDNDIILDIEFIKYLSSKSITKLLVLTKLNKRISFKNANDYIAETIKVLKLEDVLKIAN